MPLLSLAIWVPIAAALLVLAAGGDRNAALQRQLALVGAVAGFLVTILIYAGFNPALPGMQFVELAPWITIATLDSCASMGWAAMVPRLMKE